MIIQSQNLTPKAYTSNSRDFQLLTHLYDLAFNGSKLAIDTFDPAKGGSLNNKLLPLACRTVGFDVKQDYDVRVLSQVVKTFKHLVRNKGKRSAIEEAIQLLLNSQQIRQDYLLITSDHQLQIYLPTQTKGVSLLTELFDYILPVGYTYTIQLQDINTTSYSTYLTVKNESQHRLATDEELSQLDYIDKLNDITVTDKDLNATPSVNIETVVTGKKG
jgi:hypothetical protein